MASINGISLKAIKEFKGRGGIPLQQGNIYLGNKKIGFWSEDYAGGADEITIDGGYSEKKLNDVIALLNTDKGKPFALTNDDTKETTTVSIPYSLNTLIIDLLILVEDEKAYKAAQKRGNDVLVSMSYDFEGFYYELTGCDNFTDDEVIRYCEKNIKQDAKEHSLDGEHTATVYRSLAAFNIGKPISLDEITVK